MYIQAYIYISARIAPRKHDRDGEFNDIAYIGQETSGQHPAYHPISLHVPISGDENDVPDMLESIHD